MSKKVLRVYLIWFILLVLVGGSYYYFYLLDKQNELEQLEQQLSFIEQKSEALKEQVKNVEGQSLPAEEYRARIPENLQEDEVIQILNRASARTSTIINTYNYEEPVTQALGEIFLDLEAVSDIEVRKLQMQIEGSTPDIQQLNRFLDEIEQARRLIKIENLSFQSANEENISFQLVFSVFAY
ncbi:hypothetical protein ACLIA0_12135 [Bacillaceae bacterium W0354]